MRKIERMIVRYFRYLGFELNLDKSIINPNYHFKSLVFDNVEAPNIYVQDCTIQTEQNYVYWMHDYKSIKIQNGVRFRKSFHKNVYRWFDDIKIMIDYKLGLKEIKNEA